MTASAGPSDEQRRVPLRRRRPRRARGRWATNRRTRFRGFSFDSRRRCVERLSGGDLTIPLAADADRPRRSSSGRRRCSRRSATTEGGPPGSGASSTRPRIAPLFREARTSNGGTDLPVVEGKQIEPFVVDLASSRWTMRARDARWRLRDGRHMRPRLAYRDVAGPANRLTLIAAVLPPAASRRTRSSASGRRCRSADQQLLCGLFNSFVLNFLVRLRVSTHVTTAIVERLPVPVRDHGAARGPRDRRAGTRAVAPASSRGLCAPAGAGRGALSAHDVTSSHTCSRRSRWCRRRSAARRSRRFSCCGAGLQTCLDPSTGGLKSCATSASSA